MLRASVSPHAGFLQSDGLSAAQVEKAGVTNHIQIFLTWQKNTPKNPKHILICMYWIAIWFLQRWDLHKWSIFPHAKNKEFMQGAVATWQTEENISPTERKKVFI